MEAIYGGITRRALARLAIYRIKLVNKRLPAFHRTAVEDFVGGGVNFVRLIGLHEFLHVFRIFVIFARNQQVDVGESLSSTNRPSFAGVRPIWLA